MTPQRVRSKKNKNHTKRNLISILEKQGFIYKDNKLVLPNYKTPQKAKQGIRKLNRTAIKHLFKKNREFIQKYDSEFVSKYMANGNQIRPDKIKPKLLKFDSKDHEWSNLFKWVKLHWSIPISAGYGRRLRYLVFDDSNQKLIGIIGLADPVYALKDREKFIGWTNKQKAKNLRHIMDGFVIGAVPPYNKILGGKLIASLIASDQVAEDFYKKYKDTTALISERTFNGKLIAITTSSAFGVSAMYDRIKIPNGPQFFHVGWSKGSGEFQFSNGEYQNLFNITKSLNYSGKHQKWGNGPRNKRIVVREALKELGMSQKLLYHGIERELFLVPVVKNWREILKGKQTKLRYLNNDFDHIATFMINRWMIPRAKKDLSYRKFKAESYSLLNFKAPKDSLLNKFLSFVRV